MPRHLSAFALVTLLPTVLLVIAAQRGGLWPLLPLFLLAGVNHLIDGLFENRPDSPVERALSDLLPVILALCHFALLALAIHALAIKTGPLTTKLPLFLAFGLYFATVSNATGHELIHRRQRLPFLLGKWIFISHLFGHHTSAHRLVHHPFVATRFDPNTARYNESFYTFYRRAWRGSFRAGLSAENTRRGLPAESRRIDLSNPYFTYITGGILFLTLAALAAGWAGLITYFGLAIMAQGGLLLTDYVQHYGLTRSEGEDGRLMPIAPHHSWNAPHWFTRNLTLNAPLHSDHHAKPARPYTELENHPAEIAPQLPYSPGIMSVIALNPIRWRRIMNPKVAEWAMRHRKNT
ncbi:alkane 1-monooxygenase [Neptunicoccus sediminis]|uniref:alkane 1-monooxygenase n=1 Tax=Neptunicoccus sediminis TaxID=1892596 RepID=UPI000845DEB7|nr:alkane 1-monooxygenase [Neptunicoccus sediminis]